jgi:hypothetical protein
MSAVRKAKPRKKAVDPGTTCRELCGLAAEGQLPKLLLMLPPTRGEEEPWFATQVLAAARQWSRQLEALDLLECDGGSPDFDAAGLEAFLGAPGLFGGERVLYLARASKALKKTPRLATALIAAAKSSDGPRLMVIEANGSSASTVCKEIVASKAGRVERFRKLYADPPPWRPHDLDASEAAQFVSQEAASRGLRFEPGAAGALVQIAGGRPMELVQSLEHFEMLGLKQVGEVQVREIAAHSAEGSAFEFAESVLLGDGRRAFRSLQQLRSRGLRTWDGKRLAAREAFSMILAVLSKQRMQTAGVRAHLDQGADFAAACKSSGVAGAGPIAQRMKTRLQVCDSQHLARVLKAIFAADGHVKKEGWSNSLHALEYLALQCHRSPRRA